MCKALHGPGSSYVSIFPDFEAESIQYWTISPKYHAISVLYLMDFWQWECLYHHHMSQTSLTPLSPWLSCDHTFKSVRNIGIVRDSDDSWIKQYKGLFCVLNGAGQVVTWKMTKGLAVYDVEDMLQKLHNRLMLQGVTLEEFYVDNCCALRLKLQSIFGAQLQVFLDIFHAVQRITKKIPKRHPFHSECTQSLTMVFRDQSDHGDRRTMPTPPADQLKSQLLAFKAKWKDITHNGNHVLPPAALTQIQSLLVHVQKGCLSGIPPSRGTNCNERLHRNLNSLMSNSKYGLEFAYALLTIAFFKHNEKISANLEERRAQPIQAYGDIDVSDETEKFGLSTDNKGEMQSQPPLPTTTVQMKELEYHQVVQNLSEMQFSTHNDDQQVALIPGFTEDDGRHVLLQGISSFYVSTHLQGISSTAIFNAKDAYFTSFLTLVQRLTSQQEADDGKLDALLKSWNFRRVRVRGDGNCLFTSVAYSLVLRIESGDSNIVSILLKIGVPEKNLKDVECIAKLLRVRMLQEWHENIEYYQGFLTEDLMSVSQDFLDSSQFSGSAGDLMTLTIANVLQTPITMV